MTRIQFYKPEARVGLLPVGFIRTDMWDKNKELPKNTWNKGLIMKCNGTEIQRFHTGFAPERRFPTDMAGFGFVVRQLLDRPDVSFSNRTRKGHLETDFLQALLGVEIGITKSKSLEKIMPHMGKSNINGFGHLSKSVKKKTVALANSCKEKLVWHTKRLKSVWVNETDGFGVQTRESK